MRIRIVCRSPEQPKRSEGSTYPCINGVLASAADTRVFAVDENGNEHEIAGVTAVTWSVRGSDAATAWLEIAGAEIDAEAVVEGQ